MKDASTLGAVLPLPGGRLAYDDVGSGPPVVLLHGFSLDRRMWQPQVEALQAAHRVVSYDLRGFGPGGALDPTVPYAHVDDLFALLDHLQIDRCVLVGCSFGGHVVLQAALARPDRLTSIALFDALVDGVRWDDEARAAAVTVSRMARDEGIDAAREAWLAHPLFAPALRQPDVAVRLREMVLDYPGQHWLGLDPHTPEARPLDELGALLLPTLVVWGALDVPGFVSMSERLVAAVNGAEALRIPDVGHMVNLERPQAVNDALARFLGDFG